MSSDSSRDRLRPATPSVFRERGRPDRGRPAAARSPGRWPMPAAAGRSSRASLAPRNRPPATASTTPAPTRTRSGPGGSASPHANLAIATGAPGPDVLDVDHHGPAGNGYSALMRLKRADLLDAAGTIVRTPHSGLHVYFSGSSQASGRLPRHHLDFKSAGGYVLAPPSQVDGKPYRLVRQAVPSGGLDWAAVTGLLEPQPDRPARPVLAASGDVGRLAAWVERLEEGNRNAGLFWAACRAVESGQPGWLDEIAAAAARTGLTEREIARTIGSARRGARPPRRHRSRSGRRRDERLN